MFLFTCPPCPPPPDLPTYSRPALLLTLLICVGALVGGQLLLGRGEEPRQLVDAHNPVRVGAQQVGDGGGVAAEGRVARQVQRSSGCHCRQVPSPGGVTEDGGQAGNPVLTPALPADKYISSPHPSAALRCRQKHFEHRPHVPLHPPTHTWPHPEHTQRSTAQHAMARQAHLGSSCSTSSISTVILTSPPSSVSTCAGRRRVQLEWGTLRLLAGCWPGALPHAAAAAPAQQLRAQACRPCRPGDELKRRPHAGRSMQPRSKAGQPAPRFLQPLPRLPARWARAVSNPLQRTVTVPPSSPSISVTSLLIGPSTSDTCPSACRRGPGSAAQRSGCQRILRQWHVRLGWGPAPCGRAA